MPHAGRDQTGYRASDTRELLTTADGVSWNERRRVGHHGFADVYPEHGHQLLGLHGYP